MIRAVTFDFWNTLMFENPLGTLRTYRLEHLRRQANDVDPLELEEAHDRAHAAYIDAWKAGRQYVIQDAARDMHGLLDGRVAEDVLLAGFRDGSRAANVELSAGAGDCLRELRRRDVRLGIICDIGLTPSDVLLGWLADRGLAELFDAPVFSDQVGSYKPDPDMFEVALGALGVPPHEALHIGDRRRTDVGGARAFGMASARYTAIFDDEAALPEADVVLDDLTNLPEALEALA